MKWDVFASTMKKWEPYPFASSLWERGKPALFPPKGSPSIAWQADADENVCASARHLRGRLVDGGTLTGTRPAVPFKARRDDPARGLFDPPHSRATTTWQLPSSRRSGQTASVTARCRLAPTGRRRRLTAAAAPPSFPGCRVRHGMTSTLAAVDTWMTAVGCATRGRRGGSGSSSWRWVAVTGIGRRAQL